jgi:hypothetical protein
MRPVVFISHSSKDKDRAVALQKSLVAAGAMDTAFDVKNLRHGEEYRPQLFRWMARCQGGVLLITENVMAEPAWCLQEATVLRARSILEGAAFRLFMLIDKAVYDSDVWKKAFAPLKLDELQRLKLAAPGDPTDAFVTEVGKGMAEVAAFGADHRGRLAEMVFDRLAPFMAEQAAVRVMAEVLQVDDAAWQQVVLSDAALQTLFARRLAAGEIDRLGGLPALFDRLQDKAGRSEREKLLGVLRSHWVPLANAARLAEALDRLGEPAPGAPPNNLVLLHTEYSAAEKVAEFHHERRFAPFGELGLWLSVPWGNETTEAFGAKVRGALQTRLFEDEPDIPDADLVAELDAERRAGRHCFVHLAGVETLAHVQAAARRYWPCLFVLTARAATCQRLAAELGAAAIAPPHPEETRHMRDVGKARGYVTARA